MITKIRQLFQNWLLVKSGRKWRFIQAQKSKDINTKNRRSKMNLGYAIETAFYCLLIGIVVTYLVTRIGG